MSNDPKRTDTGERLDQYQTCGDENMYEMGSLFQKAVRRSDRELACFAAFELVRSGYAGFYWSRVATIMLEDLRLRPSEAHLLTAIERLRQMATTVFENDEGMEQAAAMRAASLMAEAESSRELLPMKNYWLSIAEDRLAAIKRGENPEHPFPIDEKRGELEYVVADQHTAKGSRLGRGTAHYLVEAARTTDPSPLETKYQRLMMEHEISADLTDEEIEHALDPVPADEPWDSEERFGR
jgi:hypothetical protein